MTMNFYLGREFYPYEKKFDKICRWLQNNKLIDAKKIRIRSETFRWMVDKFFKEINNTKKEEEK